MSLFNGGYAIVSANDIDVYSKCLNALANQKPILFYEDANTCYYIDSASIVGTDVILTKGGKTITIEADGDITETGDTANPTMENIKDLNGNLRFIEGDLITEELTGVTFNYNKYSLSGTHLMFVLACSIVNTTVVADGTKFASVELPSYIANKIVALFGKNVSVITNTAYSASWGTQTFKFRLIKETDNLFEIRSVDPVTLNTDKNLRVQFDLLIDAE